MTTVTEVNARILELVEKGYESGQILDILREEQEQRQDPSPVEEEIFPDAIRIISQAMATRKAVEADVEEIFHLLNEAYQCESQGEEAFLEATTSSIDKDTIEYLVSDSSYHFLVMEAPNGLGIEKDGLIIGVCCFSTSGESKKNGEVEGKLSSVRYLALRLRYQHLLVGRRLLHKVEEDSLKAGCCRIMVCVPSSRVRLAGWLEHRGYFHGADIPYPKTLQHKLLSENICLLAYLKELGGLQVPPENKDDIRIGNKGLSLPPLWRMAKADRAASTVSSIPEVD